MAHPEHALSESDRLGRQLVLDEVFDLSLYRVLRDVAAGRLRGAPAIHIVLEAIEVHGIRKYLRVWNRYQDGRLGSAVHEILEDEFKHEDMVVSGEAERHINPDKVRIKRPRARWPPPSSWASATSRAP
jgi:hypothetical protein